jgi:hypothetical protein
MSARSPSTRDASAEGGWAGEPDRLAAVHATQLLDASAEESFDRLTRIAQRLTGAPPAFMTVVDDARSYWLSSQGLAEGGPRRTPSRSPSASTCSVGIPWCWPT